MNKKSILVGVAGVFLQGAGLSAFIVISRTNIANVGGKIAIALTALGMGWLIWEGVRNARSKAEIFFLPVLLALGYVAAYHLVGLIWFPGLLSGFSLSGADYLKSVLMVLATVLLMYSTGTLLIFLIRKRKAR